MENTNVTIRMNKDVRVQFESLCENLGMNMSTAFNLFAKQCLREKGIPFQIKLGNQIELASDAEANAIAGKIMDEHIDIFKELAK